MSMAVLHLLSPGQLLSSFCSVTENVIKIEANAVHPLNQLLLPTLPVITFLFRVRGGAGGSPLGRKRSHKPITRLTQCKVY